MNKLQMFIYANGVSKIERASKIPAKELRAMLIKGVIPRSEFTGETDYASDLERVSDGLLKREELIEETLATLHKQKKSKQIAKAEFKINLKAKT